MTMDRSARNDAIAGLMVLAVVVVFGSVTSDIYIDPRDPGFSARAFPIGILTLMAILGVVLTGRAVIQIAQSGWHIFEAGEARPFLRYFVPVVVLGFLYVWLIELFQYLLPTVLALSAVLAIFGNRGFIRLVVVPIIVAVIFYVLFYGIFGLNESAGTILSYDNEWYFRPLRALIGLS